MPFPLADPLASYTVALRAFSLMTQDEVSPTTGRTGWDFLSNAFGVTAYLVVALILVALAFSIVLHRLRVAQEQARRATEQGRQEREAEVRQANSDLRETYSAIGNLGGRLVENVRSLLQLHGEITESVDASRTRLDGLQEEVRQATALTSDAVSARDRAETELKERTRRLHEAETALAQKKKELAAVETRLASANNALARRQEEILSDGDRVRAILTMLQDALRTEPWPSERGRAAVEELAGLYSPEVERVFAEYWDHPSQATAQRLRSLVGSEALAFEDGIRRAAVGRSVSVWRGARPSAGGSTAPIYYLGVRVVEGSTARDIFLFGCLEGRIKIDLGIWAEAFGTRYVSPDDWYAERVLIGTKDYRGFAIARVSERPASGRLWWACEESFTEGIAGRAEFLVGQPTQVPFVSVDEFSERCPIPHGEQEALEISNWEASQAVSFDARRIAGLELLPPEISDRLMRILSAAVARDEGAVRGLVNRDAVVEFVGRLAADALRRKGVFEIKGWSEGPGLSGGDRRGLVEIRTGDWSAGQLGLTWAGSERGWLFDGYAGDIPPSLVGEQR